MVFLDGRAFTGDPPGLRNARAREPSLLPGWTRGHLLTHLARNADGLCNLLTWARTGVMTPQYPSAAARDEDIETGAGRSAAELRADVAESAAALAAEAASLSEAAWQASVHGIRGKAHPAWYTLTRRLPELEIHHVDLGIGYRVADWPDGFAAERLPDVAGSFAGRDNPPACPVEVTCTGQAFRIGTAEADCAARGQGLRDHRQCHWPASRAAHLQLILTVAERSDALSWRQVCSGSDGDQVRSALTH
ncbi:MAG TPA: maleylpyruvate isomerase family mycothiol-dependent enzyme [Streptosporangiaceae bacterium]|nr:maleylpyruvate isomerase family mycothiol-dependent enzyme [Streptosporangiaceae bacterium]